MENVLVNPSYLTDILQFVEDYGFCKTLAVRREVIHIKHILTEIFVRKTIDIEKYLKVLDMTLFEYLEYITVRLRHIHYFSREYKNDINEIVKNDRDKFFPTLELYKGLNNIVALDFDGVITENSFNKLYELCIERCMTVICTANPTVNTDYFTKRNMLLPHKILACKGKIKKIKALIELTKHHDYVFYVDNEKEYLEFAWLFGLQTYIYDNKQIKYFTLNSK
jgi:hypothetical protein